MLVFTRGVVQPNFKNYERSLAPGRILKALCQLEPRNLLLRFAKLGPRPAWALAWHLLFFTHLPLVKKHGLTGTSTLPFSTNSSDDRVHKYPAELKIINECVPIRLLGFFLLLLIDTNLIITTHFLVHSVIQ